MTQQPEALRLAQELDAYHTRACHKEAAAELRRLHEEVQEQCRINGMGAERELKLMAEKQELLEALKLALPVLDGHWLMKAHAAIAKHGGAA